MGDQAVEQKRSQTASELLIEVLEDFGKDEPDIAMVIWTTKSGDLAWSANTKNLSVRVGLLESTKHFILKQAEKL